MPYFIAPFFGHMADTYSSHHNNCLLSIADVEIERLSDLIAKHNQLCIEYADIKIM